MIMFMTLSSPPYDCGDEVGLGCSNGKKKENEEEKQHEIHRIAEI